MAGGDGVMDGIDRAGLRSGAGVFGWACRGQPVPVGYDRHGEDHSNGGGRETVVLLPAFSTVSTRDKMRPPAERLARQFHTVVPD